MILAVSPSTICPDDSGHTGGWRPRRSWASDGVPPVCGTVGCMQEEPVANGIHPGQVQERVEQHRSVTRRRDETLRFRPSGAPRSFQGSRATAHTSRAPSPWCCGMVASRFLHGIDRERPDRVFIARRSSSIGGNSCIFVLHIFVVGWCLRRTAGKPITVSQRPVSRGPESF